MDGILVLEDGTEWTGTLFGAPVSAQIIQSRQAQEKDFGYGEVVFNTSMTGYQEVLTDPSYYGQMICMTTSHLGNTGINKEDLESTRLWCAGFILQEVCETSDHWQATQNLDHYLKTNDVPGISGIDTRALTRHIRSKGVVRGILLPLAEKHLSQALLAKLPRFEGRDLIQKVSTSKPYYWNGKQPQAPFRIIAMDFGVKWNLLRSLEHLGCEICVVPAQTSAAEILSHQPDGVFLSNGPGDPMAAPYAVNTVQELLGKLPIFGVCMGHQILSLAIGAKTYKMKFGHRGSNQPVFDQSEEKVEISAHNHGYAVDARSLPKTARVTHVNLNDQTVEGIEIPDARAFSVQYHPEACPGPHDSISIFNKFIDTLKKTCTKNI